ncbi:MAG TPA: cytochrome c [Vicinamibacterales bacterium]|nr:cytochrome c [Vicinamibacterales bacterium]
MANETSRAWRRGAAGLLAIGGLLAGTSSAFAADAVVNPTFTKDIAPIFQAKCESCHRPDSIAPMSLVTYEETRPFATSIKSKVASRVMPPWHIDKTIGIQKFKNDRSLSDAEIETIVRWVNNGAPKGDMKDMPAAVKWPDESIWNFAEMFGGPPDLIIKSTPYLQKAGAPDAWWHPVVESGVTEPRWVRAIEIRPAEVKGRKVVHHAIARLSQDESLAPAAVRDTVDDQAGDPQAGGGTFMEWAVGKQGEIMRPGSGKLLLPGSRFTWDIHYSNGGEDVNSVVEMGIYFYPKGQEPKYRQTLTNFGTGCCDIKPNQISIHQGMRTLTRAARIESVQPHMHLRGKAMSMEAILPNGQRQMLSYINDFNFNWHNSYVYADDVAPLLPKGTVIVTTSWYDNTTAKKSNPDPLQWVGYGDRTVDEMGHMWVNLTYMSDADFDAEVAARKAAQTNTQQQQ